MSNKLIDIIDITKSYDENVILDKLNLYIRENEFLTLLGPSGCGKTTLLRILGGFETPDSGNIIFDGKNIFDKEYDIVELRKKIGMVFQKPNPFPKSIYENLVYAPKLHGEKDKDKLDEIVETSLKSVALWDEVKDKLHKSSLGLSGGQQQRLCIARAISIRPEILLMDEPTSALDPISTSKIEELIRQLEKEYSIIIVTHNMQQASRISEYTGFFYQGVLEEFDKTELIFTTPHKKKTEDYITGKFG